VPEAADDDERVVSLDTDEFRDDEEYDR